MNLQVCFWLLNSESASMVLLKVKSDRFHLCFCTLLALAECQTQDTHGLKSIPKTMKTKQGMLTEVDNFKGESTCAISLWTSLCKSILTFQFFGALADPVSRTCWGAPSVGKGFFIHFNGQNKEVLVGMGRLLHKAVICLTPCQLDWSQQKPRGLCCSQFKGQIH